MVPLKETNAFIALCSSLTLKTNTYRNRVVQTPPSRNLMKFEIDQKRLAPNKVKQSHSLSDAQTTGDIQTSEKIQPNGLFMLFNTLR